MKTKQIIIIAGIFWLALQFTYAQNFTVYKFQNRANGEYLSLADDKSSITLTEKTDENRLNQSFILQKLTGDKVLIASAQDPTLFLKNDGTFSAIVGGVTADYEWELKLAGSSLANAKLYCLLVAVNINGNPVLGMTNNGTKSFQAMPNDIYNDSGEIICFRLYSESSLF